MEAKESGGGGEKTGPGDEALGVEKDDHHHHRRRRRRTACVVAAAAVLVVLAAVVLALGLTVFRPRDPKMEVVSAAVEGVSPRVSLPVLRLELNVTLDLRVRVTNRNYAGFRHGPGASLLLYRGARVGEAEIPAGTIPARGSTEVPCRLTLEVDELGSDLVGLVRDVLAGELAMETRTTIPGRVVFLGFIKKHAVAVSNCRFVVGLPELKVRSQECKNKTKL